MRITDLSFAIAEGMFRFPREYHPEVRIEITGTYEQHRSQVRRLTLGTHTGTHVDAPRHFFAQGMTIDAVPLEMLVTPAVLFDAPGEPAALIGREHLPASEVRGGEAVVIRTGWWRRWGKDFYQNPPRLAPEAAAELLDADVASIAVDFPVGLDIHELVLGRGRLLVENICRLDELKARRFWLIALPLKVADGDGAPARVAAVELAQ
jgi:kynurenine formamidase